MNARTDPRPIVLGTAGHIDHGKTALVRALTGIDCDRLPEEKARGITLELGFAHLVLPDGRVAGVVDVPGHERLVRHMVAGATGIDLVLLVVAADEGVMPQTREHLAICRLLALRRGLVALTKTDLVEPDLAGLAAEELRDFLVGTFLERAAIVPVSSVTGEGIDLVRTEIARLAGEAASDPPRAAGGAARLPIDRVFTLKGFGTVVTGTLAAGSLRAGEEIEILPAGLHGKIRGIESYHQAVPEVLAGARAAVNLQGVDRGAIERGFVITHPGRLEPGERLDAEVELLPEARPLRTRARVRLHAGTRETHGTILLLDRETLAPGERGFAQIALDEPIVALPGDRFVLRGFAWLPGIGQTIGGGRVLDAHPPRHRSFAPSPRVRARLEPVVDDLRAFAAGDPHEAVGRRVARAGPGGLTRARILSRVAIDAPTVDAALAALVGSGAIASGEEGGDAEAIHVSRSALEGLAARAAALVDAHHTAHPLEPGAPREALRSKLARDAGVAELDPRVFRLAIEEAARAGRVVIERERVRAAGHTIRLDDAERSLQDAIQKRLSSAGLEPPVFKDLMEALRKPAATMRNVLGVLSREGKVVRVKEGLYFDRGALDDLAGRLTTFLREHGQITPAEYKALTGASRKYTVPLMEHFDEQKLTIRVGDTRKLRRPA